MGDEMRAFLRAIPSLTGTAPALDPAALADEPGVQFAGWLKEAVAAGVPEPAAATLSTVDGDGLPDARVLILKDLDERGWAFAGSTSSAKARHLSAHSVAAMSFWWQPLMRAVRLRGTVVEATRAESDADLEARSASARAQVAPGDWRLWRLLPTSVEFWQGSRDRRHTRIVYTAAPDGWSRATYVD